MCYKLTLRYFLLTLLVSLSFLGWSQNNTPLFKLLSSPYTRVTFNNTISENDTLNILNQANIYNGGGVFLWPFVQAE
jgi:hypothetical protein